MTDPDAEHPQAPGAAAPEPVAPADSSDVAPADSANVAPADVSADIVDGPADPYAAAAAAADGVAPSPPLKPVRTPYQRRRRRDWIIAGALAAVVAVLAGTIYLTSDIRAVTDDVGPSYTPEPPPAAVPDRLAVAWEQPTDPRAGAVGSVYGTVVTTDQHSVIGRDVETGAVRFRYSRSNRDLCRIGSGDDAVDTSLAPPFSQQSDGSPAGILAVYERNGMCQEMVLLNPMTGERRYQRTAPNQSNGGLIFGGPYAGWVSPDRAELWRWDLYRTLQYGDQPAPPEAGTEHLGCAITDAAVTDDLLGTIEHCPDQGTGARLVLQWTDPNTKNKDHNVFKHPPVADVDTGSPVARLVGITRDRAAVLVTTPKPAVLVYDQTGAVVERFPVALQGRVIDSIDGGLTPRTVIGDTQYSLVGGQLFSVGEQSVEVTVPATTSDKTGGGDTGEPLFPRSSPSASTPETTTETRSSPVLHWALPGAIGLPAGIAGTLLVPTADGIAVVPADQGVVSRTIELSRSGAPQRVDLAVSGDRVVELRGDTVAVLVAR